MALLEIQDVTRCFGDFTAVDGVNLSIEAGEFFTLLGPSGWNSSYIRPTCRHSKRELRRSGAAVASINPKRHLCIANTP